MKLYHFTCQEHLASIRRSGQLHPTESNVGSPVYHQPPFGSRRGPDVVWLLDTASLDGIGHGLHGSIYDKTAIRITVDLPRPIKWTDWEWTGLMHPDWYGHLVEAGGGTAAVEHWYVWPATIRRRHWVSIENARTGRVLWEQAAIVKEEKAG